MRIQYNTMKETFFSVLQTEEFEDQRAETLATLFTNNTLDGVSSHGVNRFPQFISQCRNGVINQGAEPVLKHSYRALEQWDGGSGPGPLNALFCTDRAITLADEHGIGCVGLRNNTHWMRAGAYGWRAAERGYPFMCWTNTKPNMPPHHAKQPLIGNNPMVFAVPRSNGPLVLDMAMSQFSYGKLEMYHRNGKTMPYPAGYDNQGNLTDDPGKILENGRILPMGFWKGSGLSIMLDAFAGLLSGGDTTHLITDEEPNLSQVYIAFAIDRFGGTEYADTLADGIVTSLAVLSEDQKEDHIAYPGKGALKRRNENLEHGIPVDEKTWNRVLALT